MSLRIMPPADTAGPMASIFRNVYLANDLLVEVSSWDFAYVGGLGFSIAMLVAPLVTVMVRSSVAHRIMLVGALAQ